MKNSTKIIAGALLSASIALPVHAEITGNVALTSDYVWRGSSQNAEDPAIQGGLDYGNDSGIYAGVWGSSVDFGGDESTEMDLYAGWGTEFESGLGIDLGVIAYTYHGGATAGGDFEEVYVGLSYAGLGVTYSAGLDDADDNIELSYGYDFENFSVSATYGDYDNYSSYYGAGISTELAGVGISLDYTDTDSDGEVSYGDAGDGRIVLTFSKDL